MNLTSYLHKRPGSDNWQLRWMVPKGARVALGKREFTRSLGVAHRGQAEAIAYPILAEWRSKVDAVLSPSAADPQLSRDQRLIASFDAQREGQTLSTKARVRGGESMDAQQVRLAALKTYLQRRLFLADVDDYLDLAEHELGRVGMSVPTDPEARQEYARQTVQALIDGLDSVSFALEGRSEAFQPSMALTHAKERVAAVRAGETILELFERYAAQRLKEGVKRSDGVQQDRIVIQRFAEFVGKKRSLRSITRDEVRDWRDALNTLPRNFTNSSAYRGLTMREAAAKGAAAGVRR